MMCSLKAEPSFISVFNARSQAFGDFKALRAWKQRVAEQHHLHLPLHSRSLASEDLSEEQQRTWDRSLTFSSPQPVALALISPQSVSRWSALKAPLIHIDLCLIRLVLVSHSSSRLASETKGQVAAWHKVNREDTAVFERIVRWPLCLHFEWRWP